MLHETEAKKLLDNKTPDEVRKTRDQLKKDLKQKPGRRASLERYIEICNDALLIDYYGDAAHAVKLAYPNEEL